MALYFLVQDAQLFHDEVRPALAASWRFRTFEPCQAVCLRLLPTAREFAGRYQLGDDEPLLAQIAKRLPFDRVFWQHLAGELLWFSAVEIPDLPNNAEALSCVITRQSTASAPRPALPPIFQAHHGSRDLSFGGGFYRPEHAGWNDVADVTRLAAYLATIHPAAWQADDLAGVPGLPADEREQELAYLRDWFPALQTLYLQGAAQRQVVVCEVVD